MMPASATLHPIVAAMQPSSEQLPAITARGSDVVMTAGAGAGKTRTLVARYLALLTDAVPLRGIIAITFTEKAAREMRNRVRDEVRRYLETPDLEDAERARWQTVYSGLDAARISTIHGLCAEILRSHPAEARVDPRFDVLDEGQANVARRRAVEATLSWAAEGPDLAALFALLGESKLRETLDQLVRRRWDAEEAFAAPEMHVTPPVDVLDYWREHLAGKRAETLARLEADPEWQWAAATLHVEAAIDPDDRIETQRRATIAALAAAALAEDEASRLAALAPLAQIRLNVGSAKSWPDGKAQLETVKAALGALRDSWKTAEVLHLAVNPLDEALASILPGLRACFVHATDHYVAFKRERQALDFDDLEAGALALLERDPAVRERWQQETAALLVDEFQDTNDRQRRLVRQLNADRGKLFIVGDAKQSIYRFRGADVTVFREEREAITGAGVLYPLDTSYRGHAELIEGLNALLRPVLGEVADPQRPWIEPYARLHHHRQAAGPGFSAPHIELHLAVGTKSKDGLERAADALGARLLALVEGEDDVQLEENGRLRALGYGDIAILCRASTSFLAYENALERAGIPFFTVAGRGFYGRPEIRDLLNALAALADPTDDLALAGLLRSPACALSDAALYRLAEMRGNGRGEVTSPLLSPLPSPLPPRLWDVLQTAGASLPGEDGVRATRAAALIAELHAQAGRVPVAGLLKAFLDATGYRAALVAVGQARAARNVAKLLADAHASGLTGAGEFLEYVAELRDSGTREGEARADVEGAVQIMSVHAAKGLEFPVVVLGDVTYRQPSRNDILLDRTLGVLLPQRDDDDALPAIYQLGKLTADDQEAAESDRLLYVAATRAREKLILSGCIGVKTSGMPAALNGWLGKLSGPEALDLAEADLTGVETSAEPLRLALTVENVPILCAIYGPLCVWPDGRMQTVAPVEAGAILPPPLLAALAQEQTGRDAAEGEHIPDQRVWRVVPASSPAQTAPATAPAWVVGALVHEALAAWRFPDDSFPPWVAARARGYGLTDARQINNAAQKTRRLLLRFRQHPLCAEMMGAARRLMEVPYSRAGKDGRVESGVIDTLYWQEDSWTVVEFKTDRVKDAAELERVLAEEDYLAQAGRYGQAVEQLLGQQPRLLLCFLDVGGGVFVHEAQESATSQEHG